MKRVQSFYIHILLLYLSVNTIALGQSNVNALVITGGKKINSEAFFAMFDGIMELKYTHISHSDFEKLLIADSLTNFDVFVFYNLTRSTSIDFQEAFRQELKKGRGMLFLHHSLLSYSNWPEFKNIIGGKYFENDDGIGVSGFKHDVKINVQVADTTHPVMQGINNFYISDEIYSNCFIANEVKPLLKTSTEGSIPLIAWQKYSLNSPIIYIQPGHDYPCFQHESYRLLLKQSIFWLAEDSHKKQNNL